MVRFDDLISDAKSTVERIYQRFGFEITPQFSDILEEETSLARDHKSQHHYDIEEMGISPEALMEKFTGIINEYQVRK